jgi:hypothetical protein
VRANWLLSSSAAAMVAVGRRAWPELLHPPPPFPVRAVRSPDSRDARTPSLVPHHGRRWPPDGEQRHRPTIPAGKLPPELPRCSGLARWVCLGAGSTLVPSPLPETSPAAREPLVSAALLGFGCRVGPLTRGSRTPVSPGALDRVHPGRSPADFQKN